MSHKHYCFSALIMIWTIVVVESGMMMGGMPGGGMGGMPGGMPGGGMGDMGGMPGGGMPGGGMGDMGDMGGMPGGGMPGGGMPGGMGDMGGDFDQKHQEYGNPDDGEEDEEEVSLSEMLQNLDILDHMQDHVDKIPISMRRMVIRVKHQVLDRVSCVTECLHKNKALRQVEIMAR